MTIYQLTQHSMSETWILSTAILATAYWWRISREINLHHYKMITPKPSASIVIT